MAMSEKHSWGVPLKVTMESHKGYTLPTQLWLSLVAPRFESKQLVTSGCEVSATAKGAKKMGGKSQGLLYFQHGMEKEVLWSVHIRVTVWVNRTCSNSQRWNDILFTLLVSPVPPFIFCMPIPMVIIPDIDTSAVSRGYQQASSTGSWGQDM